VQSVLRRHWNQYRIQFGSTFANTEALRSASYTTSSMTEVHRCYSIDSHMETLNGKSFHNLEATILRSDNLYMWETLTLWPLGEQPNGEDHWLWCVWEEAYWTYIWLLWTTDTQKPFLFHRGLSYLMFMDGNWIKYCIVYGILKSREPFPWRSSGTLWRTSHIVSLSDFFIEMDVFNGWNYELRITP